MTVESLAEAARAYRQAGLAATWVYFIQAGTGGPIKVGIAHNPRERLATLQSGNHQELRLLAVYRGFALDERQLHDQFAHLRIRGEWFDPGADLLEYVAAFAEYHAPELEELRA